MANFEQAYTVILKHEGGYVNDPADPGGETYMGIARNMHSKWEGWVTIDRLKRNGGFPGSLDKDETLQRMIKNFYEKYFWDKISGDAISDQEIATSIFDFAVNAGVATSSSLAQMAAKVKADGIIGPDTIVKLNQQNTEHFLAAFTVAKIARYASIVKKRPASQKYFYGWVRRALGEI